MLPRGMSLQQCWLHSSGHLALFSGEDEIFAFDRCISRLTEMQTTEYLTSRHLPPP
jgi:predicted ATPase